MSGGWLFRNARLVDPVAGSDSGARRRALRVAEGRVAEVGDQLAPRPGEEVVELDGAVLAPAFCDPHVHFREPGESHKETLESGARAAVAGGFSDVAMMPNTVPPLDEAYRVRGVLARAREIGLCRMHVIAACTVGQAGEQIVSMAGLLAAGALAFSDDGKPVASAGLMRRALEWAQSLGALVVTHAEEPALKGAGVMHEGETATRLGLPGIPAACESVAIARDLELAQLAGARLHVAHVSTARGVELVRDAKRRGLAVTAETAPHYLCFTDRDVARLGTAAKMNPPLRGEADRDALLAAVADGTLDCLATDHAPHGADEKALALADAPCGVVGLETALAAALTALVRGRGVPLVDVVARMTTGPRRAFGLPVHGLAAGAPADLVAFDPEREWTVDPREFRTRGRHTPFAGARLVGRVLGTWVEGKRVFDAAASLAAESTR